MWWQFATTLRNCQELAKSLPTNSKRRNSCCADNAKHRHLGQTSLWTVDAPLGTLVAQWSCLPGAFKHPEI